MREDLRPTIGKSLQEEDKGNKGHWSLEDDNPTCSDHVLVNGNDSISGAGRWPQSRQKDMTRSTEDSVKQNEWMQNTEFNSLLSSYHGS